MKKDVLAWAEGEKSSKLISKETLNHGELISRVSGIDVYSDTPAAFKMAYEALGIDIINRVPLCNAPRREGDEKIYSPDKPYTFTRLGVYDTAFRHSFLCSNPDDVWKIDAQSLEYEDLITPVPHSVLPEDILRRQQQIGEVGCYYPMLYTTLFMWAVEFFGWEAFMVAAITEPQRFHDEFLNVFVEKSKQIVAQMAAATDCPFVFVHDDLADANGALFPPSWYDDYIFPHYPEIFEPAKKLGKSIMFVADGNMSLFLPKLIEAGVDGIQFENPATPLEAVVEHFGQTNRHFIGGVDTVLLTNGTPQEVQKMVENLGKTCAKYPGFAISSCGGLHDNIPLQNLIAYFDARADIGATPKNWRNLSYPPPTAPKQNGRTFDIHT